MSTTPQTPVGPPEPHDCVLCQDGIPDRHISEILLELADVTEEGSIRLDVVVLRENLADTFGVELTDRAAIGHTEMLVRRYGGSP